MKNDRMAQNILRRLPPPPIFAIRPPPIPPGSLLKYYQTVEILNGQCARPSLTVLNASTTTHKQEDRINWSNLSLFILAIISVIFCIIIAIFIIICLKKLRKEEKQYKDYIMTGSLLSRHILRHHADLCATTSEHYKCGTNTFNCCDDHYSHQLLSMTETPLTSLITPHHIVNSTTNGDFPSALSNVDSAESSQNHQYECIPEYFLTVNGRHHSSTICHHQHQSYHRPNTCSIPPYATFSRSIRHSRGLTSTNTSDSSQCTCSPLPSASVVQEESLTPLLSPSIYKEFRRHEELLESVPESTMIAWKQQKIASTHNNEKSQSFLSPLRKSSVLQQSQR